MKKNTKEEIKKEIDDLFTYGYEMMQAYGQKDEKKHVPLLPVAYQNFYTRALPLVRLLLPDRLKEFQDLYRLEKPTNNVTVFTFRIADVLAGNSLLDCGDTQSTVFMLLNNQVSILGSAHHRIDSVIEDFTSELRREVFDTEIDAAKKLLKGNNLRAAGAVCGVVIEKHLDVVCKGKGMQLQKKEPTINDYAAEMKGKRCRKYTIENGGRVVRRSS